MKSRKKCLVKWVSGKLFNNECIPSILERNKMKKWGLEVSKEWAEKELTFYVNGEWVNENEAKISVMNQAIVHGISIHEGVRAYSGSIFKLEDHIDRLYRSAENIGMQVPLTKDELKKVCKEFIERNQLKEAHFRIIVSPGACYGWPDEIMQEAKNVSVLVFGLPWQSVYGKGREEGIRVVTSPLRKIPPGCLDPRIKSTDYLSNYLSHQCAVRAGADDVVILDVRGFVAEMPGANLFIVKEQAIYTPKKHLVLEGITRATVIELAKKQGYSALEEDLTLYDVYTANEAFVCGTAAEITPVVEVDGRKIGGGKPGPITRKLQQLYWGITHTPQA
jgi:branched-chain amino acid aminotransferase